MKTEIILGLIFMLFLIYKVIKRQKNKSEKEQFGDTIENIVEEIGEDLKKRKEEPFKISKEEVLKKISEMFPNVDDVSLSYHGSGDDFGEFASLMIGDEDFIDFEVIEKFLNLEVSDGNTVEDYVWEVFRKANNSPDFIDAGSNGNIFFDIKNNKVVLANVYLENNYDDDGNIDWEQEEIENECEKEEF